jgi:hypothetical protein
VGMTIPTAVLKRSRPFFLRVAKEQALIWSLGLNADVHVKSMHIRQNNKKEMCIQCRRVWHARSGPGDPTPQAP